MYSRQPKSKHTANANPDSNPNPIPIPIPNGSTYSLLQPGR